MQFFSPWAPLWLPVPAPGVLSCGAPHLCTVQARGQNHSREVVDPPLQNKTTTVCSLLIKYTLSPMLDYKLRTKNCFTSGA